MQGKNSFKSSEEIPQGERKHRIVSNAANGLKRLRWENGFSKEVTGGLDNGGFGGLAAQVCNTFKGKQERTWRL